MALTTQQNPWGLLGDPMERYRTLQDAYLANRAAPEDSPMSQGAMDYLALPDNYVDQSRAVNINGQKFYRLGELGQGIGRAAELMRSNATYDPQYGYIIPQAIKDQADQLHIADFGGNSSLDRLGNAGPYIMAALLGGAAAAGAGGGAAGAAEGALAGGTTLGAVPTLGPTAAAADISALSQPFLGTGLGAGGYGAALTPAFGTTGLEAAAAGGLGATAAGNAYSPTGLSVLDNPTLGTGLGSGATTAAATPSVVQAGGVTMPSVGAGAATTAAAASPGLWSRVLAGTATADDWSKIAGNVGSTALGLYGADRQANALEGIGNQNYALAQQILARTAPSMARFEESFGPNFDLFAQPGYADAFNKTADLSTRAWSGRGVNPANNPGAQTEIQRDVFAGAYLPALANYRGINLQGAGQGINTAGSLFQGAIAPQMAATGADRSITQTLAGTLGELTKPANPYDDLIKNLRLTIGGVPT